MRFFQFFIVLMVSTYSVHAVETPWQDHQDMVKTRLIVSSYDEKNHTYTLGWEAALAPGWKTYWRSPGEAGLPVRLFSGGTELNIMFPLPHRFELFGLETYGYSGKVILPFKLTDTQMKNSLKVDFMICKDICIPFTATYKLPSMKAIEGDLSGDIRVSQWLLKVPDPQGDGGAGLAITSSKVMGPTGKQKLVVDVAGAEQLNAADMMVEGGDMFQFGKPAVRLLGDGKTARMVMGVMAAKKAPNLKEQTIRLTFTDGHGASIDRVVDLAKNEAPVN